MLHLKFSKPDKTISGKQLIPHKSQNTWVLTSSSLWEPGNLATVQVPSPHPTAGPFLRLLLVTPLNSQLPLMSPMTNGRLLVGRVCALVYTCLIPLSTLSICRIKEGVIVKNDFEMVWNVIGKGDRLWSWEVWDGTEVSYQLVKCYYSTLSFPNFHTLTGSEVGSRRDICKVWQIRENSYPHLSEPSSHHIIFNREGNEARYAGQSLLSSFSHLHFWWRCSGVKWLKRKGASNVGTKEL